jgi:hypothetical protein
MLDATGLHCRGPQQMWHTFASQLLQDGTPISYVSPAIGNCQPKLAHNSGERRLVSRNCRELEPPGGLVAPARLDLQRCAPTPAKLSKSTMVNVPGAGPNGSAAFRNESESLSSNPMNTSATRRAPTGPRRRPCSITSASFKT